MAQSNLIRLGVLTPSSNTALEPLTIRMLAGIPEISPHFSRVRVTEISLGDHAQAQFDHTPMVEAASLLADARVDVICWNATAASWLGFARDRELCEAIRRAVQVPACSSVLSLDEVLRTTGARRIALVTPYIDEVQARIVQNLSHEGYECVGERHLGERTNFAFAGINGSTIASLVRSAASDRPEAIIILCTNLWAAPLVSNLEQELGIPVYDSIATGLWGALRVVGISPSRVVGWGRLFEEVS